ncbi:MAG TPA: DUF1616 domain-containing protein [Solirubrobacteraceae bacterium]
MTLLRTLLALVIVLIAPGYLLLLALFPRGGGPRDAERVVLVIGSSVAVSVIAGLILQLTPQGITAARVDGVLGVMLVALAAGAGVRIWLSRRAAPSAGSESRDFRWRVSLHAAPLLLAGALGVVAIVIARNGAIRFAQRSSFTQLWLLPRQQGAELGVASFEHTTKRFVIALEIGGHLVDWREVTLAPGATYTRNIALGPPRRLARRVNVRLFVGNSTVPYRVVSWTPVATAR